MTKCNRLKDKVEKIIKLTSEIFEDRDLSDEDAYRALKEICDVSQPMLSALMFRLNKN